MTKYKVLKDFQWGNFYLLKGKTIAIEDQGNGLSIVSLDNSDMTQIVGTKAVEGMLLLKKIARQ